MQKYTAIHNKELVVANLVIERIPEIIVELAQVYESKHCYFNKNNWYRFLKFVLQKYSGGYSKISDPSQFYLYGYEWFNHFRVLFGDQLTTFGILCVKDDNDLNNKLFISCARMDITYDKFFKLYIFYNSVKKSVKQILLELLCYKSLCATLLTNELATEDFRNLPKGWKDKLTQLENHNNSSLRAYFQQQSFKQQLETLEKIKSYTKNYGLLFQTFIGENFVNLDDAEDIKSRFYYYLHKNNRLLCEPINLELSLLGKWRVVELNTTYNFVDESAVQNHCIGRSNNYINQVRSGVIRAFSFRKQIGESEKRHTVVYERNGNCWELGQNKSKNNYDKENVYNDYDLKCLEINMERLRKHLAVELKIQVEDDLF